ncbi:MAG TPA: phosphoribosylglycinamide formyltransferase [Crocinitomicaceae bacterium]|nr:phosphoribosylglycinamide formyltransferase [Flavobacteriales bacterium]HBW87206.1 phosphoribosylglycinamide formyltransferase [Crocinitomicaceae bacterium]
MNSPKIAILISGTGSNARRMINFEPLRTCCSFIVLSSKNNESIQSFCNDRKLEYLELSGDTDELNIQIERICQEKHVTHIILAGFLKKISPNIIKNYRERILNIHPSLLPKYGGKGMYGRHVHQAVFNAGETKTGITIHEVSEIYDQGKIIAQYEVTISKSDDVDQIEQKVRQLEELYFPEVVKNFVIG